MDIALGLSLDASGVVRGAGEAKEALKGVSSEGGRTETLIAQLGTTMSSVGKGLTAGVTAPIVGLGIAATKMAADAAEAASKMEAVFGTATGSMNQWIADLMVTVPATTAELQGMTSGMQDLLVPLGLTPGAAHTMTQEVVKLAGDLASFNNIPMETALEKIRSGMVGQYEPLLSFGVALSAATVGAKALEMGLITQGAALDPLTRAQAALALTMEGTTAAHGDAARTADSAANSLKFLWAAVKELSVAFGNVLLPVVTPMVAKLTSGLKLFQSLSPATKQLIVVVAGLAAAAGPLLIALGTLVKLLPVLKLGFAALTGPIGLTIAALVLLTAAWVKWGDDVKRILGFVAERLGAFVAGLQSDVKAIGDKLAAVVGFFTGANDAIGKIVTTLVSAIRDGLVTTFGGIVTTVGGKVAAVTGFFTGAHVAITGLVTNLVGGLKTWMVDKFQELVIAPLMAKIEAVKNLFKGMYTAVVGGSIVPDMIQGISDEFGKLTSVMVDPTLAATAETNRAFGSIDTTVSGLVKSVLGDGGIGGMVSKVVEKLTGAEFTGGVGGFIKNLTGEGGILGEAGKLYEKLTGEDGLVGGIGKLVEKLKSGDFTGAVKGFVAQLTGSDSLWENLTKIYNTIAEIIRGIDNFIGKLTLVQGSSQGQIINGPGTFDWGGGSIVRPGTGGRGSSSSSSGASFSVASTSGGGGGSDASVRVMQAGFSAVVAGQSQLLQAVESNRTELRRLQAVLV